MPGCQITIEGGNHPGTYDVACNQLQYLEKDTLYNSSSSSITLYPSGHSSNYPRISIPSLSTASYYSASSAYGDPVSGFTSVSYNELGNIYSFTSSPVYSITLLAALFLTAINIVFRGFR